MHNKTLNATFVETEDGIRAVAALLHHGVRVEDIHLILPQSTRIEQTITSGAVLSETVPPKALTIPCDSSREVILDSEEGAGIGLGLGLLTALCIPGIGLIAGSGAMVAGLMAAGTVAGGIVGGIYGHLIDRGVSQGVARVMSNHLEAGGTTLSVTVSEARYKHEIVNILEGSGGHLIRPSANRR